MRSNQDNILLSPWGVHIQPAGTGTAAVKYLGTYVARTAITDARLLSVTSQAVTFRWKDRAHQNRSQLLTLPAIEFVRRYLRHVLPSGLRSVRYYGFCHPTAKASRLRVQLHSGKPLDLGPGGYHVRFAIAAAPRAFGSALSPMRPAHASVTPHY